MPGRITEVLEAVGRGSQEAQEELLRLIYSELKRLAAIQMSGQPAHHTLQPTALLNEAWLKLMQGADHSWNDRAHFLRAAAMSMRSVLVDVARSRTAKKRGGSRRRVPFDEKAHAGGGDLREVIDVHEALEKLEAEEPEMCRLVELRFYCGLTMEETARALGISPRSAYKIWGYARAWLYREITP